VIFAHGSHRGRLRDIAASSSSTSSSPRRRASAAWCRTRNGHPWRRWDGAQPPAAGCARQPRHRDELMTVASRLHVAFRWRHAWFWAPATSRYIHRGVDVHLIDMRDDAETVTARRESKKMAPYEVSGRKLDREAAAVVSPLQQGHGCASGDV